MSDFVPGNVKNIMYCEGNTDGTIGGSFFSLLYLVSGLDKKKYNPIVVFHSEHSLLDKYHEAGIETIIIPKPVPTNISKSNNPLLKVFYPFVKIFQKGINFIKFYPLTGIRYAVLMKRRRIDILHLNNSIIRNNDWMLGAQLARIKCITHERGINNYYPPMSRYYAKRLDAIICISNAVRDNLAEKNIDHGNMVTIYNAIDPDVVRVDISEAEIRRKHSIADNITLLGVIGNIKEWKGQETIVRAMADIIKLYPDTACLLVGDTAVNDMYYKTHLQKLITQLGLEDNIIFTGYTKNVANYLNVLQLVVHTSVDPEPFGRVLIEAMSMKKPVLGTRAGAVPEVIDEGITGYTFSPGDHLTLSKLIIELLANPEIARSMGEKGCQRLIDNFHISINVANTQGLYEKILNTH